MKTSRRDFLTQFSVGLGAASLTSFARSADEKTPSLPVAGPEGRRRIDSQSRQFHLSVTAGEVLYDGLQENGKPMPPNPDATSMTATTMIDLWKEAGVADLWLNPYHVGVFPDEANFDRAVRRSLDAGYRVHFISVPVGHPGSQPPEALRARWKPYEHFNGATAWGVSVHEGCAEECVKSTRVIADKYGPCDLFLDDDFRFALQPENVGGCVCPSCKADFMRKSGFSEPRWDALLADLRASKDTKDARTWLDYFCDRMTQTFRDAQAIAPEIDLGVMVMGMGSEKAGLRLDDYRGALFRVGEWMFTNAQYDSTKNKTIELYSVLFHRRFVEPGRAFSETTIIQDLSAENYVSKLSYSTLGDVRNTMFMCPIPASYWSLIAPRMKKEKKFHSYLYGAKARGPFKHFWGLADRYCAGYNAYSLFLATGVPFEVCDELPKDGWTFLGDYSAQEMERGELHSPGTQCVARVRSETGRFQQVPETFEELFKFRRAILPKLQEGGIPYVEEETPVVLGWYPDADACYLFNAEKQDKDVTLRWGAQKLAMTLKSLDSALVLGGESLRLV
ncbi:MAG: hypothetical protein IJL92_07035 [Thermoguttaceae bacterium]|nr:hypothetical protein [Thermoguttaceae bacterium]